MGRLLLRAAARRARPEPAAAARPPRRDVRRERATPAEGVDEVLKRRGSSPEGSISASLSQLLKERCVPLTP